MNPYHLCVFVLILLSSLFLASCAQNASELKQPLHTLGFKSDREYATYRSAHIKNVSYNIRIHLAEHPDYFRGTNTITFELSSLPSRGLSIETKNSIDTFLCNESPRALNQQDDYFSIPAECLKQGKNTLSFTYKGTYASSSQGLVKHIQADTGNTYIYSDFTPNHASSLTPLFDQPDLKAKFTLSVIAPQEWTVISAMPGTSRLSDDQNKLWEFDTTPPIPSYAFSLTAGVFEIIEDTSYRFPLRILARPEVVQQLRSDMIFTMTRQSFDFYEDFFQSPYPFPKYDQLLITQYPHAAMESVGATALTETMVLRAPQFHLGTINLNDVISHEIAHMWLGNLVTLQWWDDLWLNEGLAEYMSLVQRAHHSNFEEASWEVFYDNRIQWALGKDHSERSHPIKMRIDDINEINNKFDGIAYAKSAALLRQLAFSIGEDILKDGIRHFIHRHGWANATASDFIEALEKSYRKDLSSWFNDWYGTPGLNSVEVSFTCDKKSPLSHLTQITATQQNLGLSRTLRKHSLHLELYGMDKGELKLQSIQKFTLDGKSKTQAITSDIPCPDFIYANHNDTAYIKLTFNSTDLDFIARHIGQFDYPLRDRLWSSLWEHTEGGSLSLSGYLDALSHNLEQERESPRKHALISTLNNAHRYLSLMPANKETHLLKTEIYQLIKQLYLSAQDPRLQSIVFRSYLGVSEEEEDLRTLKQMLLSNQLPQGQRLDQPTRWLILRQLAQSGKMDISELLHDEIKMDSSPLGRQFAVSVEAALNGLQNKKNWLHIAAAENSDYSLDDLKMLPKSLFPSSQLDTYKEIQGELSQHIQQTAKHNTSPDRLALLAQLVMPVCTKEAMQSLRDLQKSIPDHAVAARDSLSSTLQASTTCLNFATPFDR